MAPRSIWRGSIAFGLVSVPVRMTSATDSKDVRFHFLHKGDLVPIGYDKVRKDTGEHVDADEIVRGFEIEKGQYVPLDDEDLDRLDIELTTSRSRSSTSSISTRSELPEPREEEGGEVVDLMSALRESVERTQKARRGAKSKRAAAR
jgi:non-homologous end joining protein Ku